MIRTIYDFQIGDLYIFTRFTKYDGEYQVLSLCKEIRSARIEKPFSLDEAIFEDICILNNNNQIIPQKVLMKSWNLEAKDFFMNGFSGGIGFPSRIIHIGKASDYPEYMI